MKKNYQTPALDLIMLGEAEIRTIPFQSVEGDVSAGSDFSDLF